MCLNRSFEAGYDKTPNPNPNSNPCVPQMCAGYGPSLCLNRWVEALPQAPRDEAARSLRVTSDDAGEEGVWVSGGKYTEELGMCQEVCIG